jgi:hypothetical protein
MRLKHALVVALATVMFSIAAVPPARADVDVSFDLFYSNLSPHGSWLVSAEYGRVWQPRIYARDWNPYYDGHWEYADVGWVWVSDYAWGGIPYHYGTWVPDPVVGWVWVPGYTWAPAWVVFRTAPDYIGWAPVAPSFALGASFGSAAPVSGSFLFVSTRNFCAPKVRSYVVPDRDARLIVQKTTVINNLVVQNNIVVNRGPDVREVESAAGRKIRVAQLESLPRVAASNDVRRDRLAIAPERARGKVRAAEPVSASQPLPQSKDQASLNPKPESGNERLARPERGPAAPDRDSVKSAPRSAPTPQEKPRTSPQEKNAPDQASKPESQMKSAPRPAPAPEEKALTPQPKKSPEEAAKKKREAEERAKKANQQQQTPSQRPPEGRRGQQQVPQKQPTVGSPVQPEKKSPFLEKRIVPPASTKVTPIVPPKQPENLKVIPVLPPKGSEGVKVAPIVPPKGPVGGTVTPFVPPKGPVGGTVTPVVPVNPAVAKQFLPSSKASTPPPSFDQLQKSRSTRVEGDGRRTVIQESGNRIIIKQDNRVIIRHDDAERFRRGGRDVRSERRPDGATETFYVRRDGVRVVTLVDGSGRIVRRYRRGPDGRERNIIDNRRFYGTAVAIGIGAVGLAVALNLARPVVTIPRERYIVDYDRASDEDLYETLMAPPVETLERA